MKKWKCMIIVFLVMLLPCQTVLATNTNEADIANVKLLYAQSQLEMSNAAKAYTMEQMNQCMSIQEEKKKVSQFLHMARVSQEEARVTESETVMSSAMKDYMVENGLEYDKNGNDLKMTAEEWNVAIRSLEARLEMLGEQEQTTLVYIQDFMGQYNAAINNGNVQISNSSQRLTDLARGQSMYGDTNAGLLMTALVAGVVLGCLLTIVVEKAMKKDKRS